MVRAVLAVCAAALLCAGSSAAARADGPTTQSVQIAGAGGVQLACELTLPAGTAPDGGWSGLVLFPGLGGSTPLQGDDFATAGLAVVSCSERGTGSSGGSFDLAGPLDAKDAKAIFDWFSARPDVSDAQIGAYGADLGGAEVWNAAVAGVPFKAIAAEDTWSSLARALKPTGVINARLFHVLSGGGGSTPWNTPSQIAARSYRGRLHALTVPTLILHAREDPFVDLGQATTAFRLLAVPKRLVIGWSSVLADEAQAWFQHYLAGGPKTGGGVVIQHETPDTATTALVKLPQARLVSVNLPGTALLRSVWLTGGPLETYGGGSVTIRYSGASWHQVVAWVSTEDGTLVTEGAAAVTSRAGVLKIPLLNEMALLPRGQKVVVTLAGHDREFGGKGGGTISVGRITLRLSVLARAVSR